MQGRRMECPAGFCFQSPRTLQLAEIRQFARVKTRFLSLAVFCLGLSLLTAQAEGADAAAPANKNVPSQQIAQTISLITGVAISRELALISRKDRVLTRAGNAFFTFATGTIRSAVEEL